MIHIATDATVEEARRIRREVEIERARKNDEIHRQELHHMDDWFQERQKEDDEAHE